MNRDQAIRFGTEPPDIQRYGDENDDSRIQSAEEVGDCISFDRRHAIARSSGLARRVASHFALKCEAHAAPSAAQNAGVVLTFWRNRPTFVTGATGLVGTWLVPALQKAGASVVILVRDWVPQSPVLRAQRDDVIVVRGDVTDQPLMERVLGEYEIDTVLHLAAQTIVPIANRNPVSTFESNIRGTWSLLEACRRSPRVRQVVVASSDKAYGEQKQLPYTEESPLQPIAPYDVSKACADLIAQSYAAVYGVTVAITRCGNFYGGGDLNWNRLVPGTIRSVLRQERPVIRSDGSLVRDYLYVEDGASAYMLLAERLAAQPELRGNVFNFSNETPLAVRELVARILQWMESDLEPVILGEATHELERQFLDSTKAKRALEWKPLFSLDDGLRRTVEWYRAFLA